MIIICCVYFISAEAEATLDSLLQSRTKIGSWQYKHDHGFMLVCGVCVQIKGEIQYRLGHWQQAASLLILSIQYFGSLPQPDKKVGLKRLSLP